MLDKKIFIGLLTGVVNGFNYAKCVSLNNQKCEIQPTLASIRPNEYSQELHCYPFAVKLDKSAGISGLNYLSKKVWVPNKTENLNHIQHD